MANRIRLFSKPLPFQAMAPELTGDISYGVLFARAGGKLMNCVAKFRRYSIGAGRERNYMRFVVSAIQTNRSRS